MNRIGPEKGVIHIATGAVNNAVWDMFARQRQKPLWKLIVDMSPEELVRSTTFRYITDVLTPEAALDMLKANEAGKKEREETVREVGYPAYVTSAGWLGASHRSPHTTLSFSLLTTMRGRYRLLGRKDCASHHRSHLARVQPLQNESWRGPSR